MGFCYLRLEEFLTPRAVLRVLRLNLRQGWSLPRDFPKENLRPQAESFPDENPKYWGTTMYPGLVFQTLLGFKTFVY